MINGQLSVEKFIIMVATGVVISGELSLMTTIVASPLTGNVDMACLSIYTPSLILGSAAHAANSMSKELAQKKYSRSGSR